MSEQETATREQQSGVDDVRRVREEIAALYGGDIRAHIADTNRIVAPLLEKLGIKEGAPSKRTDSRTGTEG